MMILQYYLLASIIFASNLAQGQAIAALDWIQDRILCPLFEICHQEPAHLTCTTSNCVALKFIEFGIVPDVLQKAPPEMLKVQYGSKEVQLGNNMTVAETTYMPTVLSWTTEPNMLYTLMFSDPDAPSDQDASARSARHWLVTNIPGIDIARGNTIRPYFGPGPPAGSGFHRYNFLVYKQNGRITATDATDGYNGPDKVRTCQLIDEAFPNDPMRAARLKDNLHWSPERFAAKNGLGELVAGNFFRCQFDGI
uniref:Phosphatidylethanolamine-binding protein n=1 Tax=Plectus sambesii TaxID=2011161 RepID=A0A914W8I3_9BILA